MKFVTFTKTLLIICQRITGVWFNLMFKKVLASPLSATYDSMCPKYPSKEMT